MPISRSSKINELFFEFYVGSKTDQNVKIGTTDQAPPLHEVQGHTLRLSRDLSKFVSLQVKCNKFLCKFMNQHPPL